MVQSVTYARIRILIERIEPQEEKQWFFHEPSCSRRVSASWCHVCIAMLALGSLCHVSEPELLCFIRKATADGIANHCHWQSHRPSSIQRGNISLCSWKEAMEEMTTTTSGTMVIFSSYSGESKHDRGAKKCYSRSSRFQVAAFSCCFTAGYFLTPFF